MQRRPLQLLARRALRPPGGARPLPQGGGGEMRERQHAACGAAGHQGPRDPHCHAQGPPGDPAGEGPGHHRGGGGRQ
eukprot:8110031-Pyramimonas_sp.AAC.1